MKSFIAASVILPSANACFGSDSVCQVKGPANAAAQPAWLADLRRDRIKTQQAIGWKGGVSDQIPWTLTAYIQPQVHPYDRYLYDPETKTYTVGKYLDDLKTRYGGIDAVLVWPVYTQIGVDDKNQFDMWRSMPGGLDGVANLTAQFHEHGVKMLWPEKPWDTGTKREPLSDAKTYAQLLKQTDGDGLNGDTMGFFGNEFYAESASLGHPIALEPEGGGSDQALNWTTMGWGYWDYPEAPIVDRFKFVTEGKFLTNVCNRWAKDKTNDLQSAWFNGDGYESWENVWGVWNGITPYDGEAIRRVATMLRQFGKDGFLQSADWEPHTREVYQDGIYASRFPLDSSTVWTIVNRKSKSTTASLTVSGADGLKYYDCYHGTELQAEDVADSGAHLDGPQVSFPIEANGYGCVFQTEGTLSDDMQSFLGVMQSITAKELSEYDHVWKYLPQTIVEVPPTALASEAPAGTVLVPREERFKFEVSGVEIEGDDAHGVGTQYPWEEHPQRDHSTTMAVGPFYMDKYPVTTADYSKYLEATGYRPAEAYNWLKNWNGSTTAPAEIADLPVTYVSMAEARAYCSWKGARLPHAWEWQYAAQGTDSRTYPWGNDKDQSRFPKEQNGYVYQGPEPVTAHAPGGDSVFGVSDLVGNVWQYTSEFHDEHSRYVVTRGGSNYYPTGSMWYFPQAKELNKQNKYFLFDESYERVGTVGFRCVVDAEDSASLVV
jgi:formylglycine-generating enzyme required for sulfatase activity